MEDVSAKLIIPSGKSEKDYRLTALITILETADNNPRERLPILDDQGCIKYIAHRSLIDKFRGLKIGDKSVKLEELTLMDMVDDPVYSKKLKGFVILPPTANLAEAKQQIDSDPDCSDVFVTKDGKKESKVDGWVTNASIEKCAQIE